MIQNVAVVLFATTRYDKSVLLHEQYLPYATKQLRGSFDIELSMVEFQVSLVPQMHDRALFFCVTMLHLRR